jgi:hypothetical protein
MPLLSFSRSWPANSMLDSTIQIAIWSTVEGGLAITAGNLATTRPLIHWASDSFGWHISSGSHGNRGGSHNNMNNNSTLPRRRCRFDSFQLADIDHRHHRGRMGDTDDDTDDKVSTRMKFDKMEDEEENRSRRHVRITAGNLEGTESQEELTKKPERRQPCGGMDAHSATAAAMTTTDAATYPVLVTKTFRIGVEKNVR